MNRKTRRSLKKHSGQESIDNIAEKMFLFDKLPSKCDVCGDFFDRKDKKMVQSWKVVIKEQQKAVRLFCPRCYGAAQEVVENGSTDNNTT